MIKKMEKVFSIIAMENDMMVSGKMAILMDSEFIIIKMVTDMKDYRNRENEKALGYITFQMEKSDYLYIK